MRTIFKISYLLMGCLFCLLMPLISFAMNDFSVSPILPENQRDSNIGYFDLNVVPGQKQTIYIDLYNQSEEVETFYVTVVPGTTNRNGIIDYSVKDSDYQYDPSLTLPITELVKTSNYVTVNPHDTEKIPLDITIPEQPFEGIIIGAVHITSVDDDENIPAQKKKQTSVVNKIAYSIGIVLRETDIEPNVELNIQTFNYDNKYGQGMFQVELQNPVPMVLDDIIYDATVTKTGTDEVVAERHVKGFRFAPQSNFWLEIPVNEDIRELEPGNYTLKLSVHSEATQQSWDFESTYDLTNEESNQFKKLFEIQEEPKNNRELLIILILVILVVIVLSSVFIYYKKFNQKEQLKKQSDKK